LRHQEWRVVGADITGALSATVAGDPTGFAQLW